MTSLRGLAALGLLCVAPCVTTSADAQTPTGADPEPVSPRAADVPLIEAEPGVEPSSGAVDALTEPLADPLTDPQPQTGTPLALGDAIQIGLARRYALRVARSDLEIAEARIDEAWGAVYPRVDLAASYTRTFYAANPFEGSDAGELFGGLGLLNAWLVTNRELEANGQPLLTFDQFSTSYFEMCGADGSLCDSGGGDENPFLIPNQASATLRVTQLLYNGRAFAGIDAAEGYREQQLDAIHHEAMTTVAEVGRAYYRAQLARRQAAVTRASVERARDTLNEISRRVERGVLPQFQQLSTEVQLANLESNLMRAEAGAADAVDALKLTIGMPVQEDIALTTELGLPSSGLPDADVDAAVARAETQRSDLARIRKQKVLLEKQRKLAAADYYPVVEAVGSVGYIGNIPDDPTGGPFADTYWSPSLTAGVQLSWNLFSGFATDAAVAQREAELRQAQVQYEQALDGARLEVTGAVRNISSARRQLAAQERNVERAELNYRHAEIRVREGVSSAMELREASQQLDESRLNRLQAIHDLLLAWIDYETAIGTPPAEMRAVTGGRVRATEEAP